MVNALRRKRANTSHTSLTILLDAPIYANLFDDEGGEGYTLGGASCQVMQQLPSNRNKRLAEVLSFLLRRLGSLFAEFLIRQHEIDVAKA